MKEFTITLKYDEELEQVSFSEGYWWHTYCNIKTISDIKNALEDFIEEEVMNDEE